MNPAKNTVSISGSKEAIGFATIEPLSEGGNTVVIAGRNVKTLADAATDLNKATTLLADVIKEKDVIRVADQIKNNSTALNVLDDHAGHPFVYRDSAHAGAFAKASAEILTNPLSVVRLAAKLPTQPLRTKAAIVNISSITAFALLNNLVAYAVSKAARHSYAQALQVRSAKSISRRAFALMMQLPVTRRSQAIGETSGFSPRFVAGFPGTFEKEKYEMGTGYATETDIFSSFGVSPSLKTSGKNIWN